MKKKYSIYCSGGASRLFKFYEVDGNLSKYPLSAIVYDGGRADIEDKIKKLFPDTPCEFINYDKLMKPWQQSSFLSDQLLLINRSYNIDYTFCFGDKLLKGELLDSFRNRIINFHPSVLPSFPGLNAIDLALKSSVQILGNTAHFVTKEIDSGPIILQSVISKKDFDSYESVLSLQVFMLEKIWNWLEEDLIQVVDSKVIVNNSIGKAPPFFSN